LNRNLVFRRLWWVIGHPRPQFRAATAGLPPMATQTPPPVATANSPT
jgi:hypothetical protein